MGGSSGRLDILKLDRVNELGEYKSSYVSESGETYRLYTVGGITGISRHVWVNGRKPYAI